MGYVRVDEGFLNEIAKMHFKDRYKREKFIKSEMKKWYLVGMICERSSHMYTEKFIKNHDLIWFEMCEHK